MNTTLVEFKISLAAAVCATAMCAVAADKPKMKQETDSAPVAAQKPFVNDICLPSHLYMLPDMQNNVFVQPLIKRWRPYNDFVRFSANTKQCRFLRRLSRVATIDKPVDGAVLTTELVNGDEFETVKRVRSTLRVPQAGVGKGDVYAQIVGDSVTHGQFFRHALMETNWVPRLHLVGLLKCGNGQYNEGRGGWTLDSYFSVPKKEALSYHGFMQPAEGRYWGSRAFWKMAWKCYRKTQPKGFQPTYSCARYDDCVKRFDENTGILLKPEAGDVQFDNDANTMVRYDGKAWRPVAEDGLNWGFDYGKYLAMWNLKKPQFLFVMLGINDFVNNINADYSQWEQQINTFRKSYLAACPGGRFVICIPFSACGSVDNSAGQFTPYWNASIWRFRNWLIKTFDRREKEGCWLLDLGIGTDNEYGYNLSKGAETIPYAGYKGEERLRVQTGNPHPYPNYPDMGIPLAAFIQYYRDRQ